MNFQIWYEICEMAYSIVSRTSKHCKISLNFVVMKLHNIAPIGPQGSVPFFTPGQNISPAEGKELPHASSQYARRP